MQKILPPGSLRAESSFSRPVLVHAHAVNKTRLVTRVAGTGNWVLDQTFSGERTVETKTRCCADAGCNHVFGSVQQPALR